MGEIRVLHCVYAMNQGGIENWLMNLFRIVHKNNIIFDFLVFNSDKGFYDDEIEALGGQILYGGHFNNPLKHIWTVFNILKRRNKYSSVNIHHIFGATTIVIASHMAGLSNIIMYAHNNLKNNLLDSSLKEKFYIIITKTIIYRFIKKRIAVSSIAGQTHFGCNYTLIPVGEDFDRFKNPPKYINKKDFKIADNEIVITHIGRFNKVKNHHFLIDVIHNLKQKNVNVKCLLIGDGQELNNCKHYVDQKGLSKDVFFLGIRMDIPEILIHISDVFIFPSLHEGFGLAVVEAQAAGLPVICSSSIPNEAIIISNLVIKLDLNLGSKIWAETLMEHYKTSKYFDKKNALDLIIKSSVNIKTTISQLIELWGKK